MTTKSRRPSCESFRHFALISATDTDAESSNIIFRRDNDCIPPSKNCHSLLVKCPVLILLFSMFDSADNIRAASCSLLISNEKMATPAWPSAFLLATLSAKFIAYADLPIEGRAARIISSSG